MLNIISHQENANQNHRFNFTPTQMTINKRQIISVENSLAGSQKFLCPWDFPGKNTGVGYHFLLQRIFLNLGLNPCLLDLLHWHSDSLPPCSFFLVLHRSFNYYIFLNFLTVKGLNFLFFPEETLRKLSVNSSA